MARTVEEVAGALIILLQSRNLGLEVARRIAQSATKYLVTTGFIETIYSSPTHLTVATYFLPIQKSSNSTIQNGNYYVYTPFLYIYTPYFSIYTPPPKSGQPPRLRDYLTAQPIQYIYFLLPQLIGQFYRNRGEV